MMRYVFAALCFCVGACTTGCEDHTIFDGKPLAIPWESLHGPYGESINRILIDTTESIWAGCESGNLYRFDAVTPGWTLTDSLPYPIHDLLQNNGSLNAATGQDPFYSSDLGISWNHGTIVNSVQASEILCLASFSDDTLLSGAIASDETSGGILFSTDRGVTWQLLGLERRHVFALSSDGSNIVAGSVPEFASIEGGVFFSFDGGTIWERRNEGLPEERVMTLLYDHGTYYAGTDGAGLYRSSDEGASWVASGLSGLAIRSVLADTDGNLFAGSDEGVFTSDDGGTTWAAKNDGLMSINILALGLDALSLYAATADSGVFRLSVDQ